MPLDHNRLGVLLIGQAPRPDLTALLDAPAHACDLVVRGALDGLTAGELPDPAGAAYPLTTLLRDGTPVTVDEAFLEPLLQRALDALEREGVAASVLLCAGPFLGLRSRRLLLRPFSLAVEVLRACGAARIGVVVPTDEQVVPARRKWAEAAFVPVTWSMAALPEGLSLDAWLSAGDSGVHDLDALVLDYVGYPLGTVRSLQDRLKMPVLDLGHLAAATLKAMTYDV